MRQSGGSDPHDHDGSTSSHTMTTLTPSLWFGLKEQFHPQVYTRNISGQKMPKQASLRVRWQ